MEELAAEPSLRTSGTIVEVDHPKRGKYLTVGKSDQMSDSVTEVRRSPLLGEHTQEVLTELGLSESRDQGPAHRKRHLAGGESMGYDKTTVREILDQARAAGRSALDCTGSERHLRGLRHRRAKEGVARTATDAQKLAATIGLPGGS